MPLKKSAVRLNGPIRTTLRSDGEDGRGGGVFRGRPVHPSRRATATACAEGANQYQAGRGCAGSVAGAWPGWQTRINDMLGFRWGWGWRVRCWVIINPYRIGGVRCSMAPSPLCSQIGSRQIEAERNQPSRLTLRPTTPGRPVTRPGAARRCRDGPALPMCASTNPSAIPHNKEPCPRAARSHRSIETSGRRLGSGAMRDPPFLSFGINRPPDRLRRYARPLA